MDYRKKLKKRLYVYIIYTIIGIAMLFMRAFVIIKNDTVYSIGTILVIIGVIRIAQYVITVKDEERIKKREIAETDERNVAIWTKARSLAVTIYFILTALAVLILEILNMPDAAQIISYMIIAFSVIYCICYFILKGKY